MYKMQKNGTEVKSQHKKRFIAKAEKHKPERIKTQHISLIT